jgi:peptidoglycan L-alanyl-D-glutamate endopeptidase CwlK
MKNSRSLDDLVPPAKRRAILFKDTCAKKGIDVLITSTERDMESQASLYAIGRTVKGANPRPMRPMGDTVTNALPGDSYHNWKCAFDFVPIVNGKADWNNRATFNKCGQIAKSVGLEWAGDWKTFTELAHCQFTGGLKIADFKAGKTIPEGL